MQVILGHELLRLYLSAVAVIQTSENIRINTFIFILKYKLNHPLKFKYFVYSPLGYTKLYMEVAVKRPREDEDCEGPSKIKAVSQFKINISGLTGEIGEMTPLQLRSIFQKFGQIKRI